MKTMNRLVKETRHTASELAPIAVDIPVQPQANSIVTIISSNNFRPNPPREGRERERET